MKKFLYIALIFLSGSLCFSQTSFINEKNYAEYTLENGMQIFVLEDFSSAPVNLEYSVHAGISAQSISNTGFFPLYTRLFKYNGQDSSLLENLVSECNADSSSYKISVTPELLPAVLDELAKHAFSPVFLNDDINREYSKLRNEVIQYAQTPAAFINTSIDSRIFAEAPWKQDSGIYPQLFSKAKANQIRSILTKIGKNWYTPQNSALFISGSITKETAYKLAEKYFGSYQAAARSSNLEAINTSKKSYKFVMHDNQFSDEMTQIVMEYTNLSINEANLTAATFNSDNSSLKKDLCQTHLLNIRGPEYINVSANHNNGCSRLIFQTLLEQNKRSPLEQAEAFISKINDSADMTKTEEYLSAKKYLNETFNIVTSNSSNFMTFLSELWAIDSLTDKKEEEEGLLAEKLLKRPKEIFNLDLTKLKNTFKEEKPFIFVLVNTKTFNKYKQDFQRLGYEEINSKNGSWYTQKLFQNVADENQDIEKDTSKINISDAIKKNQELFAQENRTSISKFKLNNKIPVTVKTNRTSSDISILISIDGGKLSEKNKPGFESVMVKALSSNIKKEINNYKFQGLLSGYPLISSTTNYSDSQIILECVKEDLALCIRSISDSLIFGEITPAEADSYVYSVQTQKRLADASPVNQMTFRAMKYFYDSVYIRNIFDTEKDILQKTSYTEILAAYPRLLDANLYSIFIAGNTDSEAVHYILDETFGILTPQSDKNKSRIKEIVPEPDFPPKIRKIFLKIRHLFYTDIKAEDAGPMPAVLIPTKNFNDPLQFWFKCPDRKELSSVIFDALLFRLKEKFQNLDTDVKIFAPSNEFHCAGISFLGVEHTNSIEEMYAKVLIEFSEKLKDDSSFELEQTKNSWVLNKITESQNNSGCAKLLASEKDLSRNYIDDYEYLINSQKEDFIQILNEYFLTEPLLKIYSSDSKK